MSEIVDVIGLWPIMEEAGVACPVKDFEVFYSDLATSGHYQESVRKIDQALFEYFAAMVLPDCPTLYDHLVLSLRDKDVIATFNWDPFLMQALTRNERRAPLPTPLFLHGNVAIGHCTDHVPVSVGHRGRLCRRCGMPLQDSRLLYPVSRKNYNSDPFISTNWGLLKRSLADAFVLTIFGYGAPSSDVEAVELMKTAWGDAHHRYLEEIEIIDVKDEDTLRQTWRSFIHSHHYTTCRSFQESWIARHPRRTCEAMWRQVVDAEIVTDNLIPQHGDWRTFLSWLNPLIASEGC